MVEILKPDGDEELITEPFMIRVKEVKRMPGLTVRLELKKETKNTWQYKTDADNVAVNTLYVSKEAVVQLGEPKFINVTIAAGK